MVTENKQMELPVVMPRPRVRLDGPATIALAENATMMLAQSAAQGATSRALMWPDPMLGRMPWESKERPPMVGLWEVTDHKTGTLVARWWFGGVWWLKTDDPRYAVRTPGLSHEQFATQYAWRGLRRPHSDVYPCPPYTSFELVARAKREGHSIATPYVRFKATAPGKGVTEAVAHENNPVHARARVRL